MKIIYRSLLLFAAFAGLNMLILPTARGQIHYAAQWQPNYTTAVFTAPAPTDAVARAAAFAERNSPDGLKQLADRFFMLVIAREDVIPAPIVNARRSNDYVTALNAYRDFFVQRLKQPPSNYPIQPKPPQSRVFVEWLPTAGELMSNIFVFAMNDNTTNRASVRVLLGEPGRINWTWQPDGFTNANRSYLPHDASFASAALGARNCFDALLTAYLQTGEKAYLEKWAAYQDDRCEHWQQDTEAANLKLWTDWHFNMENYFWGVFPALAYLAQNQPNFARDLPAPTVARMLIELWSLFMPIDIRGARQGCPNRRIGMFGSHMFNLAIGFPEFLPAQYCLREWQRTFEGYTALYFYPDGSDFEYSRNYNLCYYNQACEKWDYFRKRINPVPPLYETAPPWITRLWVRELRDNLRRRADFMIHYAANSGFLLEEGGYIDRGETGRSRVSSWWDRWFLSSCPEALHDPENARIISCIYEDGTLGAPSFTSEAFPFIGSYLLRTGWGRQDLFLFLKSSPQVTWGDNNSLHLEAYGQDFFRPMWDSPIVVDGLPQGNSMTYREDYMIAEIRRTGIEPGYSMRPLLANNRRTLPNRWFTSADLDLCEGLCELPYAREIWRTNNMPVVRAITDVSHQRQVMLVRGPRLIVVTDRIRSPTAHTYRLQWKPVLPGAVCNEKIPGFTADQIVVDSAQPSIKTRNPETPNLSIYPFAALPLNIGTGTGVGALDDPYYGYTFQGQGELVVVTVLYPRAAGAPDVAQIRPLNSAEGTVGFQAELADGTRVAYQAAAQPAMLVAADAAATAANLLWTRNPSGAVCGLALDCRELKLAGKQKRDLPSADVAFSWPAGASAKTARLEPIYRPLAIVEFAPKADVFTDTVAVALSCATPDADIRYTLDGTDPAGNSPLYAGPITLVATTQVKARAFRKGVNNVPPTVSGTDVSAVMRAVYTKVAARKAPKIGPTSPGLEYAYYEGDFSLSAPTIGIFNPVKTGTVNNLFDLSARQTKGKYAFVYYGFLDIPRDGVYSIHAPQEMIYPVMDAGYDLRVFIAGEEWYPATQWHNYGAWSLALCAGRHAFKVVFVDHRPGLEKWHYAENRQKEWLWNGEKPEILISGPGLEKQPIPAGMLYR